MIMLEAYDIYYLIKITGINNPGLNVASMPRPSKPTSSRPVSWQAVRQLGRKAD
jgi:hypothetical protein